MGGKKDNNKKQAQEEKSEERRIEVKLRTNKNKVFNIIITKFM